MNNKDVKKINNMPIPPKLSDERKLKVLTEAIKTTDDPNIIKRLESEIARLKNSSS